MENLLKFLNGQYLVTLPAIFTLLIIAGIASIISTLGLLIVRKFFAAHIFSGEQIRPATTVITIIGSLTSFMVAFIVVNTWQRYHEQVVIVEKESVVISNFYRDVNGFPPPFSDSLKNHIIKYVDFLIDDGWPKLANSQESNKVFKEYLKLYDKVLNFEPNGEKEKILLNKTLDNLHLMAEYRRLRLWNSKNPVIPDMLWHVILLGSYLSIATTFFLRIGSLYFQIFFTQLHTITICLLLFIAIQFNYPYKGKIKVEVYPLIKLREEIFPDFEKVKNEKSRRSKKQNIFLQTQ